jgi:membrane fusion protein (multidrug efflux system)
MNRNLPIFTILAIALSVFGCAKKQEAQKKAQPPALITAAQSSTRSMQIMEQSVGEADSAASPKIGAEVAGRITRVTVDIGDPVKKGQVLAEIDPTDFSADAKRLEAQAIAQKKLTERYQDLYKKGFVSPSKLEEVEAQNVSTQEQYTRASKNLSRTHIVSPINGRVDNRFVSVGDWIELGKPVFQLSSSENLRIRLPFPETAATYIKVGQAVKLSTPTAPDMTVNGKIEQVRAMVGSTSRSFDAIVEVKNPGGWRPGASVNGAAIIEEHAQAVAVPEVSVVLRPAGKVVYVIEGGQAVQRTVTTGVTQDGFVEILQGIKAGETVAVDGAGFLTDKAAVSVKASNSEKGGKK